MPYVIVAGERTFYTLYQGDVRGKRHLVLVHGAGGSHLDWPAPLRRLRETNVYAIDLPGHGRSEGTGQSSIAAYRDFLLAFLDALGLEKVVVVGHSMGGAIALDFALSYPSRLTGLILVGTGARLRVLPAILTGVLSNFEATVDLILDYAFGPSATEQLRRLGRQRLLQTPPQVLHGDYAACDAFDVMERLGEIRCPTLVICGTVDKLTPPKYSVYLCDHIPGAELVLVEGAGHMVMLEKPEAVTNAVSRFIASLI
jgi:pimeloyl-ACP methyl ester carboxylesterase